MAFSRLRRLWQIDAVRWAIYSIGILLALSVLGITIIVAPWVAALAVLIFVIWYFYGRD